MCTHFTPYCDLLLYGHSILHDISPSSGSLASSDLFYEAFSAKGLAREALCPCAGSPETLTVSLRRSACTQHNTPPPTAKKNTHTHHTICHTWLVAYAHLCPPALWETVMGLCYSPIDPAFVVRKGTLGHVTSKLPAITQTNEYSLVTKQTYSYNW